MNIVYSILKAVLPLEIISIVVAYVKVFTCEAIVRYRLYKIKLNRNNKHYDIYN